MKTKSKLVHFYSSAGTDSEGRTIAEILAWNDDKLEHVHNYIQWLFPLREASAFNSDAPTLTDEDLREFARNAALRQNMLKSFERLLRFYGLKLENGRIMKAESFPDRARNWLTSRNHNFLRITRILKCLKILGFEKEAGMFLTCLGDIYKSHRSTIGGETYSYWMTAT